jgi:hypothetical protein
MLWRSSARHRGPGSFERAYVSAKTSTILTSTAVTLIALILWNSPSLDPRV